MPLPIGTRLGPFELTGSLGVGGMGEVYRARDTKLDRDVAIKVLPDHLLDHDRLARFRREAQSVAALNHPNIGAIYGLEDSGDRPALVLELVEGPTLADRIAQGPIPVDDVVPIARQIAEALEAAHEQGIIHRDLKPANIKLRSDGVVKVLDFGLAKLAGPAEGGTYTSDDRRPPDQTLSPTITSPAMTGVGIILGTAAYMAPEQAAGKRADRRADIWAFGVVLWEMLTGERLFASNESTSHVLADVLRAPIDFDRVPAGPLRELLQRCLDRDVKTRLRDIGEARIALTRPLTPAVAAATSRERGTPRRTTLAWAATAALLAASTAIALWAPWRTEPERPLMRLDVDLGDITLTPTTLGQNVIVSPDGMRLLYIASADGPTRLYMRRLAEDRDKAIELPGTEGVTGAAFSPDSQSVAFVVNDRVYRMSADGGAPLRLAETEQYNNQVAWGDGDIIIVSGIRSALQRIPPNGGRPVPLTELTGIEIIHAAPHVLPGGKTVLFVVGRPNSDVTTIEAVPVGGGSRKVIVPSGGSPHYIPTGHLLYLLRDTLFAVRFNPDTLETSGNAVPVVADVKTTYSGLVAVGGFSVDGNGTLVYRRSTGSVAASPSGNTPSTIEWVDSKGKRTPLLTAAGVYFDMQFSPDGNQILLTVLGSSGPDAQVFDPRRESAPRKLSFDGVSVDPVWIHKDGRYVAFLNVGYAKGGYGAFRWIRIDGGEPHPFLMDVRAVQTGSFSPQANRLAYVAVEGGRPTGQARRSIFTVSIDESDGGLKIGTAERFSPPQFTEFDPQFSPDGRWIAFVSDRSGGNEVYVRAMSASNGGVRYERQVSVGGGSNPRWSRTRTELLYQSGDQVISVPFTIKADTLEPEKPIVRVEKLGGTFGDVAPDGRIAVVVPITQSNTKAPAEHTVVFLQNFFDEVRRRVK